MGWGWRRILIGLMAFILAGFLGAWGWWQYQIAEARRAMNAGLYSLAKKHLIQSSRIYSKSASLHLMMARADRMMGDFEGAREQAAAAERYGGVSAETALERTLLKAQRGDLLENESRLLDLVQKNDPHADEAMEALAEGYIVNFRWTDALKILDQLLERSPRHSLAYALRGSAYKDVRQPDKALEDFEKAVRLNSEDDISRGQLAELLIQAGRRTDAIHHLEILRKRQPENVTVVVSLAQSRFDRHELEEAKELLDGLLEKEPNAVPALTERSRVALHLESVAEAEKWAKKATGLAPQDYDSHLLLLQCLEAQNKDTAVCRKRLSEIEINRQNISVLLDKMSETPRDLTIRYQLGMELLKGGRKEMALRIFNSIIEMDPHHAAAAKALSDFF